MVTPEFKCVERFIWGLAPQIMSMVTTSKPETITEAIDLSISLTEEANRLNKFSNGDQKKKETRVESSGAGRGNNGHRGFGNNNRGGNGNGNRNGGNGNRGNVGNQTGNRGANNAQGGNRNGRGPGCFNCVDVGQFKRECQN
ncbi:N66 matrix protein-like [Helianthus annuus]|uniref:N66 matrix protein-like n=1 Tax=Helianthus annuus TaxID=4232 RepID=UPI000B9094DC|nr:N66 matrix protein-like [Helianthus annuus]